MSSDHNPCQLFLLLLNLASVLVASVVVATSLAKQYGAPEPFPHLLEHSLKALSAARPSPISPASWVHVMWGVVYVWQFLIAVYGVSSVCRKWSGVPVYVFPVLMSASLLICLTLASCFNVAWFLVFDIELTSTACTLAVLSSVLGWTAYGYSLHNLNANLFRLNKAERFSEIYLFRGLVQNGLALYSTWCLYVAAFNVAVAMIHNDKHRVDEDVASLVSLGIIGVFMVFYFVMDITCLDRYMRYTATPYIVSIVVLCACLFRQKEWDSDDVNFDILAALMALAFVSFMFKSACVAFRMMRPSKFGSADITDID